MRPHSAWEPQGSTAIPCLLLVEPDIHLEPQGVRKGQASHVKQHKGDKILTWEFMGDKPALSRKQGL